MEYGGLKLYEAIEILREHNEWRRGGEGKVVKNTQLSVIYYFIFYIYIFITK